MSLAALTQLAAELGDIRVVLAGAVLTAGVLCWRRNADIALAFLAGIVLCIAATAALKLIGLLFQRAGLSDLIGSPSGHVALGTVFTGSIALILGRNRTLAARAVVALCVALVVLAIAQNRIARDAHSWFEVLEGAIVGLVGLIPLAALMVSPSRDTTAAVPAWPMIIALAVLVIAVFPMPDIDTESIVRRAADLLPIRHH
jgi:membrane-associated phospholipid phosphatase